MPAFHKGTYMCMYNTLLLFNNKIHYITSQTT